MGALTESCGRWRARDPLNRGSGGVVPVGPDTKINGV